jgi:hypothetical protein
MIEKSPIADSEFHLSKGARNLLQEIKRPQLLEAAALQLTTFGL